MTSSIEVPSGAEGKFVLIPLEGGGAPFIFQYFPVAPIDMDRRSNWEQQDTTIGTKSLSYSNRDPKKIDVPELRMDTSDTDESLTPQILGVFALQDEIASQGTPPLLLAMWGDRSELCVLTYVKASEEFHSVSGDPIRVKFTLELEQRQQGAS